MTDQTLWPRCGVFQLLNFYFFSKPTDLKAEIFNPTMYYGAVSEILETASLVSK